MIEIIYFCICTMHCYFWVRVIYFIQLTPLLHFLMTPLLWRFCRRKLKHSIWLFIDSLAIVFQRLDIPTICKVCDICLTWMLHKIWWGGRVKRPQLWCCRTMKESLDEVSKYKKLVAKQQHNVKCKTPPPTGPYSWVRITLLCPPV